MVKGADIKFQRSLYLGVVKNRTVHFINSMNKNNKSLVERGGTIMEHIRAHIHH